MNSQSDQARPLRPDFTGITWAAVPIQPVDQPTISARTAESPAPPADAPSDTAFPEGTFLGELGAAHAAELAELGHEEIFKSGAIVFQQSDPATDIYLIVKGGIRVSVNSGYGSRAIAMRGPGDLIGERAASVKRKRSATATAVGELRVIKIEAGAFTEFLQRYRDAIDVLEGQLYNRMTTLDGQRSELCGQNCTVLLVDITQFSDAGRTDLDRLAIVKACYRMLEKAFDKAGIDWDACHSEDRGDGALMIFPAHVRTEDVVYRLVPRLVANLRQHNRKAIEARCFTLRAAIDVGPVTAHERGVNGETIISTARLIQATRFKARVLEPDVVIGLATSPFVFERVARHLPDAETYEEIKFNVKDWKGVAWMRFYRK